MKKNLLWNQNLTTIIAILIVPRASVFERSATFGALFTNLVFLTHIVSVTSECYRTLAVGSCHCMACLHLYWCHVHIVSVTSLKGSGWQTPAVLPCDTTKLCLIQLELTKLEVTKHARVCRPLVFQKLYVWNKHVTLYLMTRALCQNWYFQIR